MDTWGANTFPMRKNNSRTFHTFCRPHLFRFFRRFPQINIGGDSAHFPFLEDTPVSPASPSRRRVGCDSMHCNLHLLKKCLLLNQGLLNEMTSDTWSVLCYCYVQFNSLKTLFKIWVQIILWMKGLFLPASPSHRRVGCDSWRLHWGLFLES